MERFSLHAGTLPDQPHGFTAHKQALKTLTGMCLRMVFCTAPSPGACQSWGCWVCHCPLQQGTGTQPGPGTVLRIALSLSRQDSRNGGLCKSYRDWSWNSGRCLGVQVVTQSLAGQVPDECKESPQGRTGHPSCSLTPLPKGGIPPELRVTSFSSCRHIIFAICYI